MFRKEWSDPFHGVIHYLKVKYPVQKTIVDYGSGILAYRLDLNSPYAFSRPTAEKWFKPGEMEKAKKWLIKQ